jgi:sugar phosphate isomerase/epimerase
MTAEPLTDCSRLAVHTMTNKPWSLPECIEGYTRAGIGAVSIWRNVIEPMGPKVAAAMLRDAGLRVPALVRGGFFPAPTQADRQNAIGENIRCLDEAAQIGASMVVLVVGSLPGQPLETSRGQVRDGIASLLDHARARDVMLAIEPLHPMYAAEKSCINRLADARALWADLDHPMLGVAVDVYHTWWDPDLHDEIRRAGKAGKLFAYHVCDWRVPTQDLLNDRELMGQGCIPLRDVRASMQQAGFNGYIEVEIFSNDYWAMDQNEYIENIKQAYLTHV